MTRADFLLRCASLYDALEVASVSGSDVLSFLADCETLWEQRYIPGKRRFVRLPVKVCQWCKKPLTSKDPRRRFCSRSHAQLARRWRSRNQKEQRAA